MENENPKKLELYFTPEKETNVKNLVDTYLPKEIEDFNVWFRTKSSQGLAPMEKEILKAYIFYKIFEDNNARRTTGTEEVPRTIG